MIPANRMVAGPGERMIDKGCPCGRPAKVRGLCWACYMRARRDGNLDAVAAPSANVPRPDARRRRPTYSSWQSMVARCTNPKHPAYSRYGGAGIAVCDRWLSFDAFVEDVGERPPGKTIDRINNLGSYVPGNVRWATPTEQARNRRSNHVLSVDGRAQTIAAWAEETGLTPETIWLRLSKGRSEKDAVTEPWVPRPERARRSHATRGES